ncbi:MAG: hypothetical protein JXQ82_00460 [Methanomicrobiaceae archaeon]|nr:hypothetical protein [Methanomicrobiaceae archaeon]
MKKQFFFLIFLVLALFLVHSVSAANFDTPVVKITPDQTSYAPGDSVSVNVDVKLASTGDSTFPSLHTLEAYTDLEDCSWISAIKINGHGQEQTSSGKWLRISGYILDYPSDSNEIVVSYRLEGQIPAVSSTGDKILFELTQSDGSGNLVSGGEYTIERLVINPEDTDKLRDIVEKDLETLDKKIQDKLITGVDIAAAQAKYDDARTKFIQSATASYAAANTLLSDAQTLISEGETLLNQAWAQKAINDAQETIDSTSFYLTDFKVNRSLTNDARVLNIETKIESAQSSLNSAKSLFNDKNYPQAYTLAETATTKAGEALASAETLYAEVSKGIIPDVGGVGIFLIIGIIVIVGIIGVIVYRRYTSWDELG